MDKTPAFENTELAALKFGLKPRNSPMKSLEELAADTMASINPNATSFEKGEPYAPTRLGIPGSPAQAHQQLGGPTQA